MKINFVVYGEPFGKQRPKFSRFKGFVRTYTPKETISAEQNIRLQSLEYKPQEIITDKIKVKLCFYRSIPKSFSKKKIEMANKKEIQPISKPDCDNLAKTVLDALNGVFWKDDSQIISLYIDKFYSLEPRTEIEIEY